MTTLANPKVEYNTIRDALITFLQGKKTELSVGLTTSFTSNEQIKAGMIGITPVANSLFPVLFVKIERKEEEFLFAGHAARKRPNVFFKIYAMTRIIPNTIDSEIMQLVSNLEGVLRDQTASGTEFNSNVLYSSLGITEFGIGTIGQSEKTFVDLASIELLCVTEVK